MMTRTSLLRATLAGATILGGAAIVVPAAMAQTTTARISGRVVAAGKPAAGATVTARDIGTNRTLRAVTDATGRYTLTGLRPGQFEIVATAADGPTARRTIIVGVGESATLDIPLAAAAAATPAPAPGAPPPAADEGPTIVVTGSRLIETRTSEVATNISQEQIRKLPQTDRNFLSFAALAPGVQYVDSETNKGVSSGASQRSQVNVFIDGVSLKNQVLDGGVAGQQDSRGNPFGQLAVQEFRVLTQNYKAEYEQAGAAIITAVTKSGTNEFHGELFGQYTDRSLSSTDFFVKRDGLEKPTFKRKQYGAALGGPIIEDRLFFFATYEGNDQDRAFNVRLGNRTPANLARFGDNEGTFTSPFRGDFYFGKLTLTPDENQVFDLSYSRRKETDIQGFGGGQNVAYSAAENKNNTVDTYALKWTYNGSAFVNEANFNILRYEYNPTSINPDLATQEYQGVITFGGKDSSQTIRQQSWVMRDDLTYTGLDRHSVKVGIRLAFQDYDFDKQQFVQPRYLFINDAARNLDFSFPAEARLGIGNSRIKATNSQLGLYAQDDWKITDRLELNLGIRWDYESNLFNNKYVSPTAAVATISALPPTDYFDPQDYITDGGDRPTFKKAFQPRVGFSYDFNEDQRTVLFGGYGRYYDRNVFNNTLDERFRLQYATGTFYFSRDGAPRDGNPTTIFDPSYLTRDGLVALRATAQTGQPELFAVKNDARPPLTDQFSLGMRQKIGIFQASVTGSYVKGRNGFTYVFATRNPDGSCCDTTIPRANGFGNVLIGIDGLRTRYKALFVTLDKNYTVSSGWGLNIAYTLSKAEQDGGDLFSVDKVTPAAYGFRAKAGDERHRVVVSGLVDLPLGFQFSTLTTLGTGQAYQVNDETAGSSVNTRQIRSAYPKKNCIGGVLAFCEVNVTLTKNLPLGGGHEITAAIDLFNAFNNNNFSGFDGFTNATDPLSGIATNTLTLPRRAQFRLGYRF